MGRKSQAPAIPHALHDDTFYVAEPMTGLRLVNALGRRISRRARNTETAICGNSRQVAIA